MIKNILARVWTKTKLPLLIIVLCAGTWGWTTFSFLFPPMYRESEQVWQEHLERLDKSVGDSVEEPTISLESNSVSETESFARPEEAEAEMASALPSGEIEKIIYEVAKEKKFEDPETLVRIAKAESGLSPCRKNRNSSALGIFQIIDMHGLSRAERCNPRVATAWAIDNFRDGHPWDSSRSKWDNL